MSGVTGGMATHAPATPIEVVARLAGGLSDHRELNQFLADIARAARSMLDIDRVTIFTLDGNELVPAVAASQLPDDELWATFREMPPVALDVTGLAAEVLSSRQPTLVDAHTSPLVPATWRDTFGLSSLAIAPLHADGRVRGVLIADNADPERARFSRDLLSAIGAVASLAGLALSRFEQARQASAHVAAGIAQREALVRVLRAAYDAEPSMLVNEAVEAFRACADAELLDIVVAGRSRAQAVGLRPATGEDADQIGRWRRRRGAAQATTVGGRLLVPMTTDDEVVGAMALRVTETTDMDVVRVVACAIGHRVAVRALREELRHQADVAQAATAREQLERSARLSASRMLDAAMSTIAAGSPASMRNGAVHPAVAAHVNGILAEAKGELSALEDVLLQLDTGRAGLGPKLRALAKSMTRPGTTVEVRAERGAGRPEPPNAMQIVLAVREVVTLACATRAARVIIRLADRGGTSIVEVKADGRLSLATGTNGPSAYNMVRSVQRELEPTGTRVDMSNDGSWFTVRFISRDVDSVEPGNARGSSSVCQV
jgi:hypothetical protein